MKTYLSIYLHIFFIWPKKHEERNFGLPKEDKSNFGLQE